MYKKDDEKYFKMLNAEYKDRCEKVQRLYMNIIAHLESVMKLLIAVFITLQEGRYCII